MLSMNLNPNLQMNRGSLLIARNQERSALDCTAGEVTFDDLQSADPPLPTTSDVFIKSGLHEQKPIRPNTIDGKSARKTGRKTGTGEAT